MSDTGNTRILVTSSRDWWDARPIRAALIEAAQDFPSDTITVVQGGAAGGDLISAGVAVREGWQVETVSADWGTHGRVAGFLRNQAMVDKGASVCLAFFMPCRKPACRKAKPHDSHGATDCAERAEKAGIPVRPYRIEVRA